MGIFRSIDTSASGLTAERLRMDIISNNIANVNTTRTEQGGPFRRQMVIFQAREPHKTWPFREPKISQRIGTGVRAVSVMSDQTPFKEIYDPNHPDADANGFVRMPNVNLVHEMVDMITASRAYEANVTCLNSAKDLINSALSISRR